MIDPSSIDSVQENYDRETNSLVSKKLLFTFWHFPYKLRKYKSLALTKLKQLPVAALTTKSCHPVNSVQKNYLTKHLYAEKNNSGAVILFFFQKKE